MADTLTATERTPGPWVVSDKREMSTRILGAFLPHSAIRPTVCIMVSDNMEADTALISAAPDLLEAAKLAYLRIPTTENNADVLDVLVRAIAKAAGAM